MAGRVVHLVRTRESLGAQGNGLALAASLSLGVAWSSARMVKQLLAERDLRVIMSFAVPRTHLGLA